MYYQKLIDQLVEQGCHIIGSNLVGIYLHGSMAMGCFNEKKSDIDILIVVEEALTDRQKRSLMDVIVALNDSAPAKGIEMSVVLKEHCTNFVYPTPFDLHFSVMHLDWYRSNPADYIAKMKGADPDLAAHFVIIKTRGMILYGQEIHEVFGEIPDEAYLDSIKRDVSEAKEDIASNPVYIILNLCRVLAFVQDHAVLSKKEGGDWGLENLNRKYQELIKEALHSYTTGQEMVLNHELGLDYCEYMSIRIG